MVGVRNIALAEQSYSILAVHDGAMRDSRCYCCLYFGKRAPMPNWNLLLLGPPLSWVTVVVSRCFQKPPRTDVNAKKLQQEIFFSYFSGKHIKNSPVR